MAIMSWVSRGRSPIEYVLIQLADPLLPDSPPATSNGWGLPMILVLLLYVINMGCRRSITGNRKHAAGAVDGVMSAVTVNDDGLVFTALYSAESQPDSIVGLHGDEVKSPLPRHRLTGQANSHLVKFLATIPGCQKPW